MKRYVGIIIWAVTVALATVAFVFAVDGGTLAVLSCAVILPIIFVVFSLLDRSCAVAVTADERCVCGEALRCRLIVKTKRFLPIFSAVCEIECKNSLTSEISTMNLRFVKFSKKDLGVDFFVQSAQCGELVITLKKVWFSDPLNIIPIPKSYNSTAYSVVFPVASNINVTLSESGGDESDERYSETLKGQDPSSVFGVREYVAGDSVKNIHWKLSEKTDKTMVRELSLPISDRVLLVMSGGSDDPIELSATAAALWSVLLALLSREIPVELCLTKNGTKERVHIGSTTEAAAAFALLLGGVDKTDTAMPDDEAFSHLAVFGNATDISFASGSRVTVISCGKGSSKVARCVYFSPESIEKDLGDLVL